MLPDIVKSKRLSMFHTFIQLVIGSVSAEHTMVPSCFPRAVLRSGGLYFHLKMALVQYPTSVQSLAERCSRYGLIRKFRVPGYLYLKIILESSFDALVEF